MAVAVTALRSWTEGEVTGKHHSVTEFKLVVTSAAAATITAASLGYSRVLDSAIAVKSDDSALHILAPLANSNTSVKGFSATATAAGLPVGTWYVTLKGDQ